MGKLFTELKHSVQSCKNVMMGVTDLMKLVRIAQSDMVWMARAQFPKVVRDFSLLYSFQDGSGIRPVSYPMDTASSFPGK
jgi:hypothetical protein